MVLVKELREFWIEEINCLMKKVIDYFFFSEELESSEEEEEDGESEIYDGIVVVSDIFRLILIGVLGSNEQYNVGMVGMYGLEIFYVDIFSGSILREGILMIREMFGEK